MKSDPATNEDREAFSRFDALVRKVLSVSKEELLRREEGYKRLAAASPHKRGPKRKADPTA